MYYVFLYLYPSPRFRIKQRQKLRGVEELEALGVTLQLRTERFDDYLEALQNFMDREGHADVPWPPKRLRLLVTFFLLLNVFED